jgi:phosphoribosylanthranilate isomerase
MTQPGDVEHAREAGADCFGMIFAPSKRRITWEQADVLARAISGIEPVALFVDPELDDVRRLLELFPHARIQLQGHESPEMSAAVAAVVMKAMHVSTDDTAATLATRCERYADAELLFDTSVPGMSGGTGKTFAWDVVAPIVAERRSWIAGGLRPDNVGACVQALRPYGVDVCSGIETEGRKDVQKMRAFVQAVRESDAAF